MFVCMYICMYICLYICMHVFTYVHMSACMYVPTIQHDVARYAHHSGP